MRNLKKYSNHSGYSADERASGYNVSICKSENHTHYDKPYDSKVEYLESTYSNNGGVFYVDADFVPKDTPRIVVNVCHTSASDSHMFGMPTAQVPYWLGNINRASNKLSFTFYYRYYSTTYTNFTASTSPNPYITLDVGYEVKVDGTTVKTFERQDFSANTQHVYLFGNGKYSHSVRIAWCKFYDGDTLIRDLIPVRVGQVGYMYDRISKRLFGNSGTGTFILGPDV